MPIAHKVEDEVVLRRFQGEEVEFLKIYESALIRNVLRNGHVRGKPDRACEG